MDIQFLFSFELIILCSDNFDRVLDKAADSLDSMAMQGFPSTAAERQDWWQWQHDNGTWKDMTTDHMDHFHI